MRQFENFIDKNNGYRDCFVGVYSLNLIVDKLFFDFDGDFGEAKRFYRFLREKGFGVIPVASGRKGIHIYIPLKRKRFYDLFEAKRAVARAGLALVEEAFGKPPATLDFHVIGDVKRLARIPNTLRPPENLSYCTYLPDYFDSMSDREIVEHTKSPHSYDYKIEPKLTIDELFSGSEDYGQHESSFEPSPLPPGEYDITDGRAFLSRILRPCLYKRITQRDPPHCVRVASTADLLNLGLTEDQIFRAYSTLGWVDFDPSITRYQITSCKGLKPYSCRRLRELGIPTICCWG